MCFNAFEGKEASNSGAAGFSFLISIPVLCIDLFIDRTNLFARICYFNVFFCSTTFISHSSICRINRRKNCDINLYFQFSNMKIEYILIPEVFFILSSKYSKWQNLTAKRVCVLHAPLYSRVRNKTNGEAISILLETFHSLKLYINLASPRNE